MKLKRIFACALALVFTASTIIAQPASAKKSVKNVDESQEIICSETNEGLTKLNDKSEKVNTNFSPEKEADEPDDSDSENSETETDEIAYDDDETDEKIETLNKQIEILRRENTTLKIKSGILNLLKTCSRKLVTCVLVLLTSFVLLISTDKGIQILNNAIDNFGGPEFRQGLYPTDILRIHTYAGVTISTIPTLLALLFV